MNDLLRPRIWPSFSRSCRLYEPEAWCPRVFLRQAQDRLPLRRTVKVRLGTNPAVPLDGCPARGASACAARGPPASPERAGSRWRAGTPILFALATLRSVPQAGSQFRGLATAMHKISWLTHWFTEIARVASEPCGD